jgi:hypothetical protein
MAKDARLELGRYITNPFNEIGTITKQLDFNELFRAKPETGEYPWNPSRFTDQDLLKRAMTKKLVQNPTLNFVSNAPFFDDNKEVTPEYEVFEGIGRFNRPVDYDFDTGRPNTEQRPEDQPDFNPAWVDAYKISPTLVPSKAAKNPMPRLKNPDPNGFMMKAAEARVENEMENKQSVAQLLSEEKTPTKKEAKEEEQQATKTEEEEQQAVG